MPPWVATRAMARKVEVARSPRTGPRAAFQDAAACVDPRWKSFAEKPSRTVSDRFGPFSDPVSDRCARSLGWSAAGISSRTPPHPEACHDLHIACARDGIDSARRSSPPSALASQRRCRCAAKSAGSRGAAETPKDKPLAASASSSAVSGACVASFVRGLDSTVEASETRARRVDTTSSSVICDAIECSSSGGRSDPCATRHLANLWLHTGKPSGAGGL
mmetsp:Transcript_12609/g.53227  ORF Transcript_12609/g.53227 Transcript_12609/m.53227 type:complete len:219 (+) Transcript_12609:393-1049(+)